MELRAEEFLRRFLLHVLPTGFVRIRHYGLLANRARQDKLTRARQLLAIMAATPLLSPTSAPATDSAPSLTAAALCPHCASTRWRRIARLLPQRGLPP
jgi:putative transposase